MARKKKATKKIAVKTYKHESAKRKNIPTAKMAAEGEIPKVNKAKYSYSPHLSPELQFDSSGHSDRLAEITAKVIKSKALSSDEAEILRGVAANASHPWLEWSRKREENERGILEVEPVALHIHERVSANAIIRAAKRQDIQADLFADPKQEYKDAIQFYRHDVDWANRLILGDSLEVMESLASREDLAGKVQMVYIDPPYGIKFASNFQSLVGKRDVKDKDADLTREPEMVKAYRDTWELGVHSYLSYLRERLIVAKKLISGSGSVFVQISDENLHRVRQVLDEVFGAENYCGIINFQKTGSIAATLMPSTVDYILWFARDKSQVKYRQLYVERQAGHKSLDRYDYAESDAGELVRITAAQIRGEESLPDGGRCRLTTLLSDGEPSTKKPFQFQDTAFPLRHGKHWKTDPDIGGQRLAKAGRVVHQGSTVWYKRYVEDFPVLPLSDRWESVQIGRELIYVVQTAPGIIERCMLMTTDPGDIVLDPTCGSGTAAFVAEKWGRRWITIDSSRVALSLARQRLLTASYEHFRTNGDRGGTADRFDAMGIDPSSNFVYRTVPHITLSSIAHNEALDSIFENHDHVLEEKLTIVNQSLRDVSDELRSSLVEKLATKMQEEGIKSAKDADRRRWLLPGTTKDQIQSAFMGKPRLKAHHIASHADAVPSDDVFRHWQIPFDTDADWPSRLRNAVTEYRQAWRSRMDEINECIRANSDQEALVDQPEVVKDVVRVTGPFTVEGVRPEEMSLTENGELVDPTPNQWESGDGTTEIAQNASAYIDRMLQLILKDGVTFPNNEHRKFEVVDRLDCTDSALHAEAHWEGVSSDEPCSVAIAFGPQHGPVTAEQIEDLVRASRRYDEIVIAGFSFDGAAQAVIQESANPRLKIHMAHIRPDASPGMDGLLKDSPKSQLFTVFGQPEIEVRSIQNSNGGEVSVELLGVDIYSPLTGEIRSSGSDKVAAWFLDSDYDGRCFCTTQAFFPNQKAWDKIAKALGSAADAEAFSAYNGTVSLPFEPGEHKRVAVKVIDPRGNEVMAIRSLEGLI